LVNLKTLEKGEKGESVNFYMGHLGLTPQEALVVLDLFSSDAIKGRRTGGKPDRITGG